MSRFTTILLCVVLAALAAGLVAYFPVSSEVDAAPEPINVTVSAPVAPQPILELGLDGLPKGSLVFYVDGATCVAVPGVGTTCFCPCDGGTCNAEVEAPMASSAVTNTASYTVTDVVTSTTSTVEVPSSDVSANDAPTTSDEPNGGPEDPAVITVPAADDTPDTPDVPADNPNKGPKGNNGLGNGVDPAPPGIDKQGKPQNDDPATPGDPQYKGKGSDGEPNGKGGKSDAPGQSKDKGKK